MLQNCNIFDFDLFGLGSIYNYFNGTTDVISGKTAAEESDEDVGITGER